MPPSALRYRDAAKTLYGAQGSDTTGVYLTFICSLLIALARDLLYKYFGQLELLELRFSEIKVNFPWRDAFTNKLTTQTSIAYEKASILFQIAGTQFSYRCIAEPIRSGGSQTSLLLLQDMRGDANVYQRELSPRAVD